jgi:hypothetical protein
MEIDRETYGLVILLLLGGAAAARADNDIYKNILKQPRGDDALHADGAICDAQFGAPQNGAVTSRVNRRCMLSHGWRFSHTIRGARRPLSRSRQSGPDVPGLQDRRHHRVELLELRLTPAMGAKTAMGTKQPWIRNSDGHENARWLCHRARRSRSSGRGV